MHPEFAPMMLGMTLFIVTGAVILLRPITRRLGTLLEVLAEQRRRTSTTEPADTQRIVNVLETLEQRIARLEERQEFTDALLGDGDTPRSSRR
jgi:hypothetical protein